ncbi:MAG TPA: carboxypeptidase regulatory-like domain-containing protein [Candidatus Acidoferrum sp.]|nr:carboxypeptidase regulatory-like domain-containing protein [Candidatus Acidoferrum sp.]
MAVSTKAACNVVVYLPRGCTRRLLGITFVKPGGDMRYGLRGIVAFVGLAVFVLSLLVVGTTQSQVISGDLIGTVLDKSGGVVPNATVEAVNVATNVKYPTQANSLGDYRLSNLPAGTYNVTASAPNFASTRVENFKIELNKSETLTITLEVKTAVATIEVIGATPALDTTSASLASSFDEKTMADLPTATQGLGVLNLALLGAGVASSGGIGAGTGPSVGGQRPRNNDFTIEGVDNNDKSVTGPLVYVPNDAVAEFSMLENQYSPEFGHSSGGQFNQVIKSGTNTFHGSTYIYSQNRNFNAIDQATKNNGYTSNQRYDNNRMGGTIGGPILKDKLFFFGTIEYNPVGQATVLGAPVCAPTAAGYTALAGASGISATNLGILTKYVAPAATAEVAPAGKNLCGLAQFASGPNVGQSYETAGGVQVPEGILTFSGPNYTNYWAALGSIDYNISSKDQIRGRYVYNSGVGIDTAATLPAFYLPTPNKYHLVAINYYHTFSPTLTNEFRLGYNRYYNTTPAGNFSFSGLDSFPNVVLYSLGGINIGPDPNAPQFTIQNTYQATEAVTWTRGRHTLKAGIEGRKLIAPESFTQRARGDYEYNSLNQYLEDISPDYLAQRSVGASTYYADQSAIYWFANDNWRMTHNLTVNLGVRYEYTTTPFSIRSQQLNNIASVPGLVNFVAPQAPKNDWAPRVGFAYSPGTSGTTSIRGGFGIGYDVHYDNIGILSLPPELSVTENSNPAANTPDFLANGGLPPGKGGVTTFPTAAAARAATSTYYPYNVKDPKSINWTLGVQHSFWKDYTGEIRYVGTRGIHLDVQEIVNLADEVTPTVFLPTYTTAPTQATLDALPYNLGGVYFGNYGNGDGVVPIYDQNGFNSAALTSFRPDGSSTYHGLAMQLTKRMGHGLQLVGSYTYSHLIDNSTADFHTTDITPRRQEDFTNLAQDRANSALDHRHRVTLAVVYDLPYFKGSSKLVSNTLGNWEFAPVYTYQSGEWGTVQDGVDANLNGDSAGDRAIVNASGIGNTGSGVTPLCTSAIPTANCVLANVFCTGNPAIDGTPSSCTVGVDVFDNVVGYLAKNPTAKYIQAYYGAKSNLGRNTLQMPPINDLDLTAVKRFSITERYKVEFGAQFFNVLNHPQFIAGSLNNVNSIGVTGSARAAFEPQAGVFDQFNKEFPSNARSIQLSLKFIF